MREYFHVPENYFLSHSVGCLPLQTQAAVYKTYFEPWENGKNWDSWMPVLSEFRTGIGMLLGVRPDLICPQKNISSALSKVLYSLPFQESRKTILLSQQDFPTVGFIFKQAERFGYRLKFLEGDPENLITWEAQIDSDTAIVHITHALSNTSHLLPVGSICARAQHYGATTIVDVAQSCGVVPINANTWNADFIIGTGVKFLCFGPGACFLYLSREKLETCHPIDVGWFSHDDPFEMQIDNFRYAEDAMKFFGGTPSPAPLAAANCALALWRIITPDAVHKRIKAHLSYLTQNIPETMIVSPQCPDKRGGTLVISPKDKRGLRTFLKEENILYDERDEGFRFSVHGYTSEDEIIRLTQCLESFE